MPRLGKFRGSELWFGASIVGSQNWRIREGHAGYQYNRLVVRKRKKKKGGGKDNKRLLLIAQYPGVSFLSFSPEKELVKFVDKK